MPIQLTEVTNKVIVFVRWFNVMNMDITNFEMKLIES